MSIRPILAALIFAATALTVMAAAACPFDAAANGDPNQVASSAPSQGEPAGQPSSAN